MELKKPAGKPKKCLRCGKVCQGDWVVCPWCGLSTDADAHLTQAQMEMVKAALHRAHGTAKGGICIVDIETEIQMQRKYCVDG